MPPYSEFGRLTDRFPADRVWHDGTSNDIIILGEKYKLVSDEGAEKLVINFEDDPKLSFAKSMGPSGLPLSRPRKGGATLEDLKKTVKYVVLHSDLTHYALKTYEVLVARDLSSHFCINWNGIIYQFADVGDYCAHAGADHNTPSIGIDMNHLLVNENNPANREQSKEWRQLMAYYKSIATEKLRERGFSGKDLEKRLQDYEWEQPVAMALQFARKPGWRCWGYTPRQYKSLIALLKVFVRVLDLEKHYPMTTDGAVIPHVLEDDDKKQLRGLVAHWHLTDNRTDPGPAFDWQRVLSGLRNEYNWFPLAWKDELILQGRQYPEAVAAAHELVRNNEAADAGGTYPMGPNQTWHGGIHLFPPQPRSGKKKRTAVHAMFDGSVVAAHFEEGHRKGGHNNFVVLRHAIEIPKRKGKIREDGSIETETFKFFSLYMHLDSMPVDAKSAREYPKHFPDERFSLNWLGRMYDFEELSGKAEGELDKAVKALDAKVEKQRAELRAALDRGDPISDELAHMITAPAEQMLFVASKAKNVLLQVGEGKSALNDPNKVAVFKTTTYDLRVSAGEVLGYCGFIPGPEQDELVPGIHVEIFATHEMVEKIDMDAHGTHFRTPQRARGSDLTVRTEDILMIFRNAETYKPYGSVHLWPDERLRPQAVRDFFGHLAKGESDPVEVYREQFRRSITYHVSEWSDRVDWVASLTGGQPWSKVLADSDFKQLVGMKGLFSMELRQFLPFIWLTEDVALGIGLRSDKDTSPWDGRVYHLHPIHFVMWVSFFAVRRNRIYRTTLNLAGLRKRHIRKQAVDRLVAAGRHAKHEGGKPWQKWQDTLPKELCRHPFNLTPDVRRKDEKKQAEYDEVLAEVMAGIEGEVKKDVEECAFGVIENLEPIHSDPKEVLERLFDLPPKQEWKISRGSS